MNFMDTTFGDGPVEQLLSSLQSGDTLSATRLLTVMDGESESVLDAVLDQLCSMNVTLNTSDLPKYSRDSQIALRLRQEEALAKQEDLLQGLDATDPLRLYLEELAGIPVCGDVDRLAQQLLQANRDGQEDAPVRNDVLNLCLHRVVAIARAYTGNGVLLLDLIQEGSMGLWEALQIYRGGAIEEFCDMWIDRYMRKAVIKQAHAAGVGQKLRQALEDYRSEDEKLLGDLGRNPTTEEIAEALHISPEETEMIAGMLENARILQRAKQPEPEQLPQEEDQAVEDTAYFQMRQRIADLLSGLSEKDAKLLSLRYGLEGGVPMNPTQVAAQMGLTEAEVISIEAAALSKLRQQN